MIGLNAFLLNIVLYIVFILPLIISMVLKKSFNSKKELVFFAALFTVLEIILSIVLYIFSYNIFSLFTNSQGVVNLSVFMSRILFLDCSLFAIKFLFPFYLYKNNKKTAIFVLLKIAVNIVFSIIGYLLLHTVGFLYSFPLVDLLFYILIIVLFIKIN